MTWLMPMKRARRTLLALCLALAAATVAQPARAADADNGKRLAQLRCASCHIVLPGQRREVADSPPLEVIGRKFDFNVGRIAASIRDVHPRMNLTPTRREAEDIAAYIGTLGN
jgi:mono/diheme cytochrome c family protein